MGLIGYEVDCGKATALAVLNAFIVERKIGGFLCEHHLDETHLTSRSGPKEYGSSLYYFTGNTNNRKLIGVGVRIFLKPDPEIGEFSVEKALVQGGAAGEMTYSLMCTFKDSQMTFAPYGE